MIYRVLLGVAVLVAVSSSTARAGIRRPGEVVADVTVRQWPEDDAPPAGDLFAGAQVVAHERRHGWLRITGPTRGWIPAELFTRVGSEDEQRLKLLADLAAASKEAAPEDRTDADLMYDAVRQWHGEPPESAKIDRVLAQSKKEADRTRSVTREKVRSMFWKDPFADNPQKLVLVRQEDRNLIAAHVAKRVAGAAGGERGRGAGGDSEVYRLRVELASVRAELASARAEASRARAELARLEDSRGDQGSSRGEATATREDSREDSAGGSATVVRHARRHARHLADRSGTVLADATPAAASDRRRGAARSAVPEAAPPPADAPPPTEKVTATPPSGWRSSDPRGIIVVPMDTPVIVRADKKPRPSR